jgi:hypothetical protein
MKPRALRIPAVLAVAVVGVPAAIALVSASCGGDDAPPKDAMDGCAVYCVSGLTDAGVPPDGGCPVCADVSTGVGVCPEGCTPLG